MRTLVLLFSEHAVELAARIKSREIGEAAHEFAVDKNLRDGSLAGALSQLSEFRFFSVKIDFFEFCAFAIQKIFGANAERAVGPGIDFDFGHK